MNNFEEVGYVFAGDFQFIIKNGSLLRKNTVENVEIKYIYDFLDRVKTLNADFTFESFLKEGKIKVFINDIQNILLKSNYGDEEESLYTVNCGVYKRIQKLNKKYLTNKSSNFIPYHVERKLIKKLSYKIFKDYRQKAIFTELIGGAYTKVTLIGRRKIDYNLKVAIDVKDKKSYFYINPKYIYIYDHNKEIFIKPFPETLSC